jgi:hypothetical protein
LLLVPVLRRRGRSRECAVVGIDCREMGVLAAGVLAAVTPKVDEAILLFYQPYVQHTCKAV